MGAVQQLQGSTRGEVTPHETPHRSRHGVAYADVPCFRLDPWDIGRDRTGDCSSFAPPLRSPLTRPWSSPETKLQRLLLENLGVVQSESLDLPQRATGH